MAVNPRVRAEIRDFSGMVDAVDVEDIPEGAAEEQVNLTSVIVGVLQTRQGYRFVTFEAE